MTDPKRIIIDAPEPQGEAAILAELRQTRAERNTARASIALAKQVLLASGHFTPDEVGDDIAPRITEWSSHHREQLRDTQLAAAEARGETVRVAAVLREILARYRPLTDHKGRVVGWTALGVTPADFDRWTAVAFTSAGAVEEELSTLVNGHLAAFDEQTVTPATDAPRLPHTDVWCPVDNVPHGPHTWGVPTESDATLAHCPGTPSPLTRRPSTPANDPGPGPWPLPQRASRLGPNANTDTALPPTQPHGTTDEITVTCGTCSQPIQGTISDHMAEAHGMPKIWPNPRPLYVDDFAAPDAELVHPDREQQASAPPQPGDCGPDCADGHMYDGYCTENPHLEGVTTPGHETPHREGAAWSCAEDDGCGHLSLGHSSEAAARRSYDRHRARTCPRTDQDANRDIGMDKNAAEIASPQAKAPESMDIPSDTFPSHRKGAQP